MINYFLKRINNVSILHSNSNFYYKFCDCDNDAGMEEMILSIDGLRASKLNKKFKNVRIYVKDLSLIRIDCSDYFRFLTKTQINKGDIKNAMF